MILFIFFYLLCSLRIKHLNFCNNIHKIALMKNFITIIAI